MHSSKVNDILRNHFFHKHRICYKARKMSVVERDAGFCSGGDDEDLEVEDDLHSPTDASEDSVEVKVSPISLRNKNKRKCAEPRKVSNEEAISPYKKRRHFGPVDVIKKSEPVFRHQEEPSLTSLSGIESNLRSSPSPFRPWSHPIQGVEPSKRCPSAGVSTTSCSPPPPPHTPALPQHHRVPQRYVAPKRFPSNSFIPPSPCPHPASIPPPVHPPQYTERVPIIHHQQEEPLSLVLKTNKSDEPKTRRANTVHGGRRLGADTSSVQDGLGVAQMNSRLQDIRMIDIQRLSGSGLLDRSSNVRDTSISELQKFLPELKRTRDEVSTTTRQPKQEAVDFSMFSNSRLSESVSAPPTVRKTISEMANEDRVVCQGEDFGGRHCSGTKFSVESLLSGREHPDDQRPGPSSTPSTSSHGDCVGKEKQTSPGGQQRNYKNMTRERRIEANARERTRVHTISAAFDTLRRSIPSYSHNQKLSKLSVLRIACSYILTLSRVAGDDYSADSSEPSLADCVDLVSRTIQTEGKLRRKKED